MYNFMKQNYIEVERGIGYMNYQREVAIVTEQNKTRKRRIQTYETMNRIKLAEQNKTRKRRIQTYETMKHLAKKWSKNI